MCGAWRVVLEFQAALEVGSLKIGLGCVGGGGGWLGVATGVPQRGRALQMPDVVQLGNGRDGGDVVFAHMQDVGRVHPLRFGGGERFACAVKGFNHKL